MVSITRQLFVIIHQLMSVVVVVITPTLFFFFFFNDTAPPEISPLPLPDALPIYPRLRGQRRDRLRSTGRAADRVRADGLVAREPPRLLREEQGVHRRGRVAARRCADRRSDPGDRKSTRLNSSHDQISYAVFCLKK